MGDVLKAKNPELYARVKEAEAPTLPDVRSLNDQIAMLETNNKALIERVEELESSDSVKTIKDLRKQVRDFTKENEKLKQDIVDLEDDLKAKSE